jgi:hypothetical protein
MPRNPWFSAAILLMVLALARESHASGFTLQGRVYQTPSGAALSSLTIRLIPPKDSKQPPYVTITTGEGSYRLVGLPAGSYVLEASQGPKVVFRRLIEIEGDTTTDIALRAK